MHRLLLAELEIVARVMPDPTAAEWIRALQSYGYRSGDRTILYEQRWVGVVQDHDPAAATVVLPVVAVTEPGWRWPRWWRRRSRSTRAG